MVRVYRGAHNYPEPPSVPLLAFFLRYPNPFARHVQSVDVLSRYIDPVGRMHTTRLILKSGIIPQWAAKWLPIAGADGRGLDAWILEESVVDPPNLQEGWETVQEGGLDRCPRLPSEQGNLNHRKFMHIIEGGEISAGPNGTTKHLTTAEVRSDLGGKWSQMLRKRIESYGVGKFEVNTETSRKGMSFIIALLRTRQPLPDNTAEYYPPPPPGFSDKWPEPPQASSAQETVTGGWFDKWRDNRTPYLPTGDEKPAVPDT